LKRLKSGFNISPTPDNENATFLKSMASKMTDLEKYVVLQLDEIYVNSSMQYRGGKLYGIAENQNSSEGESNECTRVPSHRAKTRSRERIKVKLSTEPREQKPSEPRPSKEPGERSSNPRIFNYLHQIILKTATPIRYQKNKQKTRQTPHYAPEKAATNKTWKPITTHKKKIDQTMFK
jgi:hypothetical protein